MLINLLLRVILRIRFSRINGTVCDPRRAAQSVGMRLLGSISIGKDAVRNTTVEREHGGRRAGRTADNTGVDPVKWIGRMLHLVMSLATL
jgi:hypothetical protein